MVTEMSTLWVARFVDKQAMKYFVQGVLGCTCPADVFEHYLVRRVERSDYPYIKIIVGERLLIYTVPYQASKSNWAHVAEMLKIGHKERDLRGLNRFRLVIMGASEPDEKTLEQVTTQLADPKVHLHFIRNIFDS